MLAIGADGAESVDLENIASQSPSNNVYQVPDYDGLSDIVDSLVQNICTEAGGFYTRGKLR